MSAAEVSRAGPKDRIDPKLLAALVNRFVADSSEFLQGFALQAEASLLGLSARIQRLEQLVKLLERKVDGIDDTLAPNSGVTVGPTAQVQLSPLPTADNAPAPQSSEADAPEATTSTTNQRSEPPPMEDEKYAKYRKMHRNGVPLLAIRQRLLMDAAADPSLDVSILDTFDGAAGLGAGAPVPVSRSVAAPVASILVQPVVSDQAKPPQEQTEEEPVVAEPDPLPETSDAGGLAGEAMRAALRRIQRMETKTAGEIGDGNLQASQSRERLPDKPASSSSPQADSASSATSPVKPAILPAAASSKTLPAKPASSLFVQVGEAESTGATPADASHSERSNQNAKASNAPVAPAPPQQMPLASNVPVAPAPPQQMPLESSTSVLLGPGAASLPRPKPPSADAVLRMRRVVVQDDDADSDASGGW